MELRVPSRSIDCQPEGWRAANRCAAVVANPSLGAVRSDEIPLPWELEARANGRLGTVLNEKYRLDRLLGLGGMAAVYAATHRNGKEVAVKLMHPELAGHAAVRNRFLREGYVANLVKHPGAVSVLDDDVTDDGWAFLVMELLDGVTLEQLWEAREAHIHPACVSAVMLQLLEILAAAHASGVVHRDVKPANIFLLATGELKVLDFGIACMRFVGHRTTNVGTVLGTPAYMAPEQAAGDPSLIDAKTDIWAAGAVAFSLLVGEMVHTAETTEETLRRAATSRARSLAPLALGVPPAIARVFDRALRFDRAARWTSAQEMRDALAVAARDAYGEEPGRAAIRAALARRMNVGQVWRETLEPPASEQASPVRSEPAPRVAPAASPPLIAMRGPRRDAVHVATLALVLGASLAFLFLSRAGPPASSPALPGQAPPVVAAATTSRLAGPTPPPEPEPEDGPSDPTQGATRVAPVPPRRPVARAAMRPASAAMPPATPCVPPFTIDPVSRIKKWKVECF